MSLQQYEEKLIREGRREDTIKGHLRRMKQLQNDCIPLDYSTLEQYLIAKKRSGVLGASLNRLIITLRSFHKVHPIQWIDKVKLFPIEEPNKSVFSDEEILQVINMPRLPNTQRTAWDKWTMWLKILAFSGMRPNEVAKLTVEDVDWGSNNFLLDRTKTKPRRVPIAKILHEELQEYIKDKEYYLFPTPKGHFESGGWSDHLNKRLKFLNIKRSGLSAHCFRHSFISNLWEESVPLPDIMNIVGHRNPKTTLAYSHLGNRSAQKSINRHSIIQRSINSIELLKLILEDATRRGVLNRSDIHYEISENKLVFEVSKN